MKKIFRIAGAILLVIVLASGCSGGPQLRLQNENKENEDKVKAAILSAGSFRDDDKIFKNTVTETGGKEGVEFQWQDAAGDALHQEEQLAAAIQDKVKVVVIEPVDPELLKSSLVQAQTQGVKIICLNSLPPDTQVEAYLTPDFTRAGEMQAQQLTALIPEGSKANVLILRDNRDHQIEERIYAGNINILRSNNRIGAVRTAEIALKDAGGAYEAVRSYLTKESESAGMIPAVIAHWPEHAEGMLKALKELPADRKVLTFGMGTQKAAIEAIEKGQHSGEVDLMPEFLAQLTVKAVKSLAADAVWEYEQQIENGPYSIQARFAPIRLITQENVRILAERMKNLEKAAAASGKEQEPSGQEGASGPQKENPASGSGASDGAEQKIKSTVTIKTKDGQEYKMDIPGEVANIEIKSEGAKEESGEQEGGGEEQ